MPQRGPDRAGDFGLYLPRGFAEGQAKPMDYEAFFKQRLDALIEAFAIQDASQRVEQRFAAWRPQP